MANIAVDKAVIKTIWELIADLDKQANADERRFVGAAMSADAEAPLPHEMHVTLSVEELRLVSWRLQEVTRMIVNGVAA